MGTFLSGRIAEELSFYRIRDEVASCAKTAEGAACVLSREPLDDEAGIRRLKALGAEWGTYLGAGKDDAVKSFPQVHHLFALFRREGSALTEEELLALGLFCKSALHAAKTVRESAEELSIPHIAEEAALIPELEAPLSLIEAVIEPDGTLRDLPELHEAKEAIRRARNEIEAAIKKYTSDTSLSQALQTTVPALRQERQLLAVRADRSGSIRGIVHEVSASGQTLFIEPEEAVRANNELVQAQFRLRAETHKILVRTTSALASFCGNLEEAHRIMLLLDETCAAARWGTARNAVFAQDCTGSDPLALVAARHPLLGKSAVPIDVRLPGEKNVLIITGPNTGGKTVTLKTVALFALMNQAGFPVPAADGTRLPVFSSVFADIGDEQSIDQSLSTFSSHMKNIALMTDHADSRSLILLDELGSGTDPEEGGAIAQAVLDALMEKNALILVTTHHGCLKQYGYTRSQCTNASVEFDSGTARPTYRLVMGIPGESHALDIALRAGLPRSIVEAAAAYMDGGKADIGKLIQGLSQKHEELDRLISEQQEKDFRTEQKKLALLEREADIKARELSLSEIERRQSFAFLRETRSKLENLVREIREGEITREKTLAVRSFINNMTDAVNAQEKAIASLGEQKEKAEQEAAAQRALVMENGMKLTPQTAHSEKSRKKTKRRLSNAEALARASAPEKGKSRPAAAQFVQGAFVQALNGKAKGTLVKQTKPHVWTVQFGSVRMTMHESELLCMEPPALKSTTAANIIIEADGTSALSDEKPAFELRLLGMRAEEALKALEHQMDLCAVHGFRNFSVIHGKGNGILQQAVHDYLSHAPGVKDFRFAPPEDGGTGKTYVELH